MMSAMVWWEFEYYLITSLILILASSSGVVSLGALPHNHSLSLCHEDESSALLHFKQSFVAEYPHSKINTWAKGQDCCSWEGVKCDQEAGRVIGLDLSYSLYGNFPSNSSLFSLTHLQELDLSYNYFSSSTIPSELGQLTNLVSLDLGNSKFSGEIPLQLSKLSKLSFIDLSVNSDLTLKDVSLEKLVQNFTGLTHLDLQDVDISSPVPTILANFTSLKYLSLIGCNLRGSFPSSIFSLPHLETLYLTGNSDLKGFFPEFQANSSLKKIDLWSTAFYGQIPASIGRLSHLEKLLLQDCSFSGSVPSSLGKLTQLTDLYLGGNQFKGGIPSSLANLTALEILDLSENQLVGPIALWLTNLTQLRDLRLNDNDLKGLMPKEISQLGNLNWLDLFGNHNLFDYFDTFMKLPSLTYLDLSGIPLKSLENPPSNMSHPKLQSLYLKSCNLTEFPRVLGSQDELFELHLSLNKIHGLIPQWFVNITKNSLGILDVSNNSLTGFEQPEKFLPWNNLGVLSLRGNQFQGLLPVPPNSMQAYDVSYNQMAGGIPQQLCQATSLKYLDISNNNLSGQIPDCISSELGSSLQVLNLRGNNFNGIIPHSYPKSCQLKMIALDQNQLEGSIPRSLLNCTMLAVLDIGQNRVNDTFPSWLGNLPDLQILILRHNNLHGRIISRAKGEPDFPSLRIIDLSHNFHIGHLPSEYLHVWDAMKTDQERQSTTSGTTTSIVVPKTGSWSLIEPMEYNYSIMITNKGNDLMYTKILTVLRVIDFSSNNFTGEIPNCIGELKGLQALNLSNNNLEGGIPSSLSNIRALESLDLSTNKLSGGIPQELAQLTFLEVFNVSHNLLTGPIPQGTQFDTFDYSSFDGNPGLCGIQVPKTCGNVHHESPPSLPAVSGNEEEEEEDSDVIDWIIRALGCVAGFIVGYVIGNCFTDRHHDWFVETFGKKRRPRKTRQGAPRRRT